MQQLFRNFLPWYVKVFERTLSQWKLEIFTRGNCVWSKQEECRSRQTHVLDFIKKIVIISNWQKYKVRKADKVDKIKLLLKSIKECQDNLGNAV